MNILTALKDRLTRDRLASEQGFTLIELLIVIVILGILAAIAVPTYLSFVTSAHTAAAQSNVRTAIPAAENYYETTGAGSTYTGMTGALLRGIAPGIASTVKAEALNGGQGYCVDDTESGTTYSYAGGNPGAMSGTNAADTLETGLCSADVAAGTEGT